MDRPTIAGDVVVADGLWLERLDARFHAVRSGRAHGDSSAAPASSCSAARRRAGAPRSSSATPSPTTAPTAPRFEGGE
jgi:hypothetical protein